MTSEQPIFKTAFLLGEDANVMDTAGPWEVFQDTRRADGTPGFALFTVAPTRDSLTMSGGLRVTPHYGIADAPRADLVVVPAHRATPDSLDWLAEAAGTALVMSVCTGAFQLGRAGLLEGLAATTHHEYFDRFAEEFPHVELRRDVRFVDNGRIATAGGLTSGIDLALCIVARLYSASCAKRTARYMEYTSKCWRTPTGQRGAWRTS